MRGWLLMVGSRPQLANGLHWLRYELEQSLGRVRSALEQYLDARADRAPLLLALDELGLVRGGLRMVECHGAQLLADEMVALLRELLDDRIAQPDEAYSALSGAALQLFDYLDLLADGTEDRVLVLQPLINELRLARGRPVLTEADLLTWQLQAIESARAPAAPVEEQAARLAQAAARRELPAFQMAFLQWFRDQQPDESLRKLAVASTRLSRTAAERELKDFWTAAAALAESLPAGQPHSLDIKRLFGRAGTVLRQVAEQGERLAATGLAEVRHHLLLHLGRVPAPSAQAQQLIEELRLDSLLPSQETLDATRRRLRGPNTLILDRVCDELKREFAQIKDAIDLAVRVGELPAADLDDIAQRIERLAATIGVLGLPAPQQALQNQAAAIRQLPAGASQWMAPATALLRVELALQESLFRSQGRYASKPPRSYAEIEGETPPSQDQRDAVRALLRESMVNLALLKTAVENLLKGGDIAGLSAVPGLLQEISAGLRVLERDEATALIDRLRLWVERGGLRTLGERGPEAERFADAIAGIEVYLEAVRDALPRSDRQLQDLARFIARLEPGADGGAEPARQPSALYDSAGRQHDDPELRGVFLEEAAAVLADLQRQLPLLLRQPQDRALLGSLRRSFHTLKGSGRTVGAQRLGDLGWAIERMLTQCIEGALPVAAPVLEALSGAIELLPDVIEAYRQQAGEPEGLAELIAHADELASGPRADNDMLGVFREDARERLAAVARWLEAQDLHSGGFRVPPELVRAFHTLRGAATAIEAPAISTVAGAIEGYLGASQLARAPLSVAALALLADAIVCLRGWVEAHPGPTSMRADAAPWLERIEALQAQLGNVQTKRDAVDPYCFSALSQLEQIEQAYDEWAASPATRPERIGVQLDAMAVTAARIGDATTARVAYELSRRVGVSPAQPQQAYFRDSGEVLESLHQALDRYRNGESLPAEPVLSRIAALPTDEPAEEVDAELLQIFLGEAEDLMQQLDAGLAAWQQRPHDAEAQQQMRRAAHTMKGSARMAGLATVGEASQRLERLIDGEIAHPGEGGDQRIGAAIEALRRLLDEVTRGLAPVLEAPVAEPVAELGGEPPVVEPAAAPAPAPAAPMAEALPPSAPAAPAPTFAAAPTPAAAGEGDELFEVFAAEAAELLEALDGAFEAWQAGDEGDAVRDVQRSLHTLKGSARMVGHSAIGHAAHELESQVNAILSRNEFPDAATFRALRQALDALHTLHDGIERGAVAVPSAPAAPPPSPEPQPQDTADAPQWSPSLFWRPDEELAGAGIGRRETARVPVDALEKLLDDAGEVSICRSRLEQQSAQLRAQLSEMTQTLTRLREQLRQMDIETEAQIEARGLGSNKDAATGSEDRYGQDFDPLEMDRYSRMQELSRALTESVGDMASLHATIDEIVAESDSLLQQQGRVSSEVQQGLMGTLMVPFSRQVPRLQRVVAQTARVLGVQAEAVFAGVEAELDRNVLERMTAPLEHLLRNAVVHGIETPEARAANGKPETGDIRVSLKREGSQLLVEVADDGRGLDIAAIRAQAVQRGLMQADALLPEAEVARFILEPGFSTARELTQDAGRGIGMDVVAAEVKQLGGTLDLASEPGRGTRFRIRLPLTLAVSQALLVQLGQEAYAIPLTAIEGIARVSRAGQDAWLAEDAEPLIYGGQEWRTGYLGDLLGLPRQLPQEARSLTAVLLRIGEGIGGGERRLALVVDQLIGNREIVLKPVGPQIGSIAGLTGATILADGRVVLILDIAALVADRQRRRLRAEAMPPAPADVRELVMVIDDSVTMRRVAERLLTRNGYRVITAHDGLDAMALLQTETPAVVLLDIEMPRADGFEVAAFIRNSPRLGTTPIIMITSRSGEKHRERARQLGVERYLIKPYQEEQLLHEIAVLSDAAAPLGQVLGAGRDGAAE